MAKLRASKGIGKHRVVSHKAWIRARRKFLAKEKKFTRLRDELARQRRALPWEKVDKQYVFDGPKGRETLPELFDGRSQLVVYHFMFAPDWNEGCKHCSFWADNFNGLGIHLNHRDVSLVAISRAPLEKLEAFKRRMGWSFKWVSSGGNDFNYDYQASFTPQEIESAAAFYNYAKFDVGVQIRRRSERPRGRERVPQGRERRRFPHVLELRAGNRHAEHRLPLPRPRSQGAGRGRPGIHAVLGPASRQVRGVSVARSPWALRECSGARVSQP